MPDPVISIIIVNYNVKDFLSQALHSVQKAIQGIDAEIFVVDNASRDSSVAMIRDQFPQVQLIANQENVGFARANNQAIAKAKGTYLVLLNPDTLVQEDTFSSLLNFFERYEKAGMVGCKILNPDGSLQLACRRSIPTPWVALTKLVGLGRLFPRTHLFGKYNMTYCDPDQITAVDAVSGSFMMLPRQVIREVGMLDERFFMYGEDLDLCYRIKHAGWEIYYVPETKVIHYKGASSQKAGLDTILTFYRAMLLFAQKHFRRRYLFLPQWFLIMGIGFRAAISFLHNLLIRLRWPLVDLLVLNLSLVLALLIRFGSLAYWQPYVMVTIIYSAVWLVSFYFFNLYDHRPFSVSRAVAGVVIGLIVNSTITYFAKYFAFSRLVVLLSGAFNLIFIPGWRWGISKLSQVSAWPPLDRIRKRYLRREAIIVGSSESVSNLLGKLNKQYQTDMEVVAVLITDDHWNKKNGFENIPVVSELKHLPWYIKDYGANEVIFTSDSVPYEKMFGLIAESETLGVDFKIASKQMEVMIGSSSVDYLGDISLIDIEYQFGRAPYRLLKRFVDVFWAVPLILLSPVVYMILRFRGFKLDKLPIFTRNEDFDLNGYQRDKSKIQKHDQSRLNAFVFTKNGDIPQSFWQKLPLLFYVLKGDLSLVGTDIRFQPFDVSNQISPTGLKPGLTSFAQVMSPGSNHQPKDYEKYDLYYLKNYSPWLDLEILFKSLLKR